MKKIFVFMLSVMILLSVAACDKKEAELKKTENGSMPTVVSGTMTFKDYGTIQFELYTDKAPQSALNFIYLAKQGFYDGIVVHRLVKDFVIQAGAYESGYVEKKLDSPYNIKGEFSSNGIDNEVKHVKGTLSWARPMDYNGASTQFFICTNDTTAPQLDGNYAAFGMVTNGFDVLDKINEQSVDENDFPINEIEIESVIINSEYEFPNPDFIR